MIPNLEDGEAVGRGLEVLGDHRHRLVADRNLGLDDSLAAVLYQTGDCCRANQPVVEKAHLGRHFSAREVGRKSGQSCHVLPGYPILSRCFDQIEK